MADKLWLCAGDVGPLRETFTPPGIVLGNRVKLREVKGKRA